MVYLLAGLAASALMLLYGRPTTHPATAEFLPSFPHLPTKTRDRTIGLVSRAASFAILAGASALRFGPGTDYWERYVPVFERVRYGIHVDMEPGYLALNRLALQVSSDYQGIFVATSLITVGLTYRFISRMSVYPALSVFVYVFGGTYLESFNLVRQGLAIAILLNSIEFIFRNKPIPFVLLTLVASTFHSSALLWLAVWPLVKLGGSAVARVVLLAGFSGVVLAAPSILNAGVERFAPQYSWYFESNYGTATAFDPNGLVIAVLTLAALLAWGGVSDKERKYARGLLNLQIVQITTLLATMTIAFAFSRISYYFTPISILVVPLVVASISKPQWRHMATVLFLLAYGTFFYIRFIKYNAHEVLPYVSIFSR